MPFIMGLPGYVMLAMALIITQATITYGSIEPVGCLSPICSNGCVPDVAQDSIGLCPICVCPLCMPRCRFGYECQFVDNVFCKSGAQCLRQSQCVRIQTCIDITCLTGCTKYDSRGCPYCECPTPTCATMLCTRGYVCEMLNSRPVCIPVGNSCSGQPIRRRCYRHYIFRWTYDSSQGLCQKFRYYFCRQSFNTFRTPEACERKCEKQDDVLTDFSELFVSKLKEDECPEPQCTIECPSGGLKTDESGCQICECLEEE